MVIKVLLRSIWHRSICLWFNTTSLLEKGCFVIIGQVTVIAHELIATLPKPLLVLLTHLSQIVLPVRTPLPARHISRHIEDIARYVTFPKIL